MQLSINEGLKSDNWHNFYNKDGNQGPYKFRLTSFSKIDLSDYKSDAILENRDKKDNWSFWLLRLDLVPLVSNCFLALSTIAEDISICDNNGNFYNACYKKPSSRAPGICEALSLHKYDYSIRIPNCEYKASLLFHLPNSTDDYIVNYTDAPNAWYKTKVEHNNEIPLDEAIDSSSWYKCKFKDSPDLDIRVRFSGFDLLPLSQAFETTNGDSPFYRGYYNLEDSEFKIISLQVINISKRDNNDVGGYLLGRLILLDNAGLCYAASGAAGSFAIDFTSRILDINVLSQPLTPKITYDAKLVYLVAKNISPLSLGLRYGTLERI
jgi:hypothetical protein